MAEKIRVAVVDDSALMRRMISSLLASDPAIEVVGTAMDPYQAREMIKKENPDVLTLDVEMPRMDGLSFLEKIMRLRPMPVVMVSTLTQKDAEVTLQALEIGAVDFVAKPTIDVQQGLEEKKDELISKVKAAARARVTQHKKRAEGPKRLTMGPGFKSTEKIIAIGASTGGVEALKVVLQSLPADVPAILITQHMPGSFTNSFANRLDGLCAMNVSEAEDGVRVLPGHAYIAKGGMHLELVRSGGNYHCRLTDAPLVSGHKPSVDVLFHSVAKEAGQNAVGVILTGMGRDGAEGLKAMRDAGAPTFGQDEASSLVYGMPRVAKELGGVAKEVSLSQVAKEVIDCFGR
ncbi:MAG: protein-glutamate methylesterase/protein-glutamine glutaminase [Magnetovibrionaceae bacterium]